MLVGRLLSPTENRDSRGCADVVTLAAPRSKASEPHLAVRLRADAGLQGGCHRTPLAGKEWREPFLRSRCFRHPSCATEVAAAASTTCSTDSFSVISSDWTRGAAIDAKTLQLSGIGARFVAILPPTAVRAFAPAATGDDLVVVGDAMRKICSARTRWHSPFCGRTGSLPLRFSFRNTDVTRRLELPCLQL